MACKKPAEAGCTAPQPGLLVADLGQPANRGTAACDPKTVLSYATPPLPTPLGLLGRWLQRWGFSTSCARATELRVRMIAEARLPVGAGKRVLARVTAQTIEKGGVPWVSIDS